MESNYKAYSVGQNTCHSRVVCCAVVEGLPGHQRKRAASASLVKRLQQLGRSDAPASGASQQRFQLLGTMPSNVQEQLAVSALLNALVGAARGSKP